MTADEFVLNEDFHRLVLASKLPRQSKFVDQSISFGKGFCKQLFAHGFVQSDILRGLSAFDSAVIFENPKDLYVIAIEKLTPDFVSVGLFSPSDKVKAVGHFYQSCVLRLILNAAFGFILWLPIMKFNVGRSYSGYSNIPACV